MLFLYEKPMWMQMEPNALGWNSTAPKLVPCVASRGMRLVFAEFFDANRHIIVTQKIRRQRLEVGIWARDDQQR
jgi:hypothetical protein